MRSRLYFARFHWFWIAMTILRHGRPPTDQDTCSAAAVCPRRDLAQGIFVPFPLSRIALECVDIYRGLLVCQMKVYGHAALFLSFELRRSPPSRRGRRRIGEPVGRASGSA